MARNRRFEVTYEDGKINVWDHSRENVKTFSIGNFVYGTGEYEDSTRKLPDYVHQRVWELFQIRRP